MTLLNLCRLFCVGIKVIYDLTQPVDSRVKALSIRCADCIIPEYQPVENNKVYSIITSSFLYNGGDGYSMIKDNIERREYIGQLVYYELLNIVDFFLSLSYNFLTHDTTRLLVV